MDETAKTSLDFVRRRDYKGAIETFTMKDLSDPAKETYNDIINAIIDIVSQDIAESRSELTKEMVLDASNMDLKTNHQCDPKYDVFQIDNEEGTISPGFNYREVRYNDDD
eukprot:UN11153